MWRARATLNSNEIDEVRSISYGRNVAIVTRDHALGLETGRRADHVHLRVLSRSAVSALVNFFLTASRCVLLPLHPTTIPASSFLFPSPLSLRPHRHRRRLRPHEALPTPRHRRIRKRSQRARRQTHTRYRPCRRQTQPRMSDTRRHSSFPFLHSLAHASPCHASPRATRCHTTPRHASPRSYLLLILLQWSVFSVLQ